MTMDWHVWSERQALDIPIFVVLASVTLAGTGNPRACFHGTSANTAEALEHIASLAQGQAKGIPRFKSGWCLFISGGWASVAMLDSGLLMARSGVFRASWPCAVLLRRGKRSRSWRDTTLLWRRRRGIADLRRPRRSGCWIGLPLSGALSAGLLLVVGGGCSGGGQWCIRRG